LIQVAYNFSLDGQEAELDQAIKKFEERKAAIEEKRKAKARVRL
jgi:hypothetical protein